MKHEINMNKWFQSMRILSDDEGCRLMTKYDNITIEAINNVNCDINRDTLNE